MYPYHMHRAQYLETGNVLLECKFATDSMEIAGCIVTAYLLNKRNLITKVIYNTHISHVRSGENPQATVKSIFKLVSVSVCGVQL